ncbi:MAG: hypothetical protein J3R72DRAFT_447179 [Linnemannia gamsii]|nr:MAG: hypothetical protein J3R72DRAFT_447179 [Linnemannia gamsii]
MWNSDGLQSLLVVLLASPEKKRSKLSPSSSIILFHSCRFHLRLILLSLLFFIPHHQSPYSRPPPPHHHSKSPAASPVLCRSHCFQYSSEHVPFVSLGDRYQGRVWRLNAMQQYYRVMFLHPVPGAIPLVGLRCVILGSWTLGMLHVDDVAGILINRHLSSRY